jgi:hypothetical protein
MRIKKTRVSSSKSSCSNNFSNNDSKLSAFGLAKSKSAITKKTVITNSVDGNRETLSDQSIGEENSNISAESATLIKPSDFVHGLFQILLIQNLKNLTQQATHCIAYAISC